MEPIEKTQEVERIQLRNIAYNPTKFDYFYLLYKIVCVFLSYFQNGAIFITTMMLSFNCYYDSYMFSDEKWKLVASIVLFLSLFVTICLNFIYFSNFMYFNRLENGKEFLRPRHFLILKSLYQKKIPKLTIVILFLLFNFIIPFVIGTLDILFYCNSNNIRLLLRLYCIRDGKTHEDVKKRYSVTYKIILIGFIFLDIPSSVVSVMILSSKNSKIIDNSLTSSNLSAIYCLTRITITIISNVYFILKGLGIIEKIINFFRKKENDVLKEPLAPNVYN